MQHSKVQPVGRPQPVRNPVKGDPFWGKGGIRV